MPNYNAYGSISSQELYTLEQIAAIFGETAEWVRDYFVRPIDRRTKKLKIDPRTNRPLHGVPHMKCGVKILIAGSHLLRWIEEHSEINEIEESYA